MDREFYVHAAFGERIEKFADFVLGLGDGHAVAGDDDYFVGGGENGGGFFGGGAADGASLFGSGAGDLFLAEGAEEHVGEGAIHRFGHIYGEDEAGGAIEGAGDDEQFAIEDETHGCGGESGIGIQQRDDGGHIGAPDGNDHEYAEDQRNDEHQREQMDMARIANEISGDADGYGEEQEIDEVLSFICDGALRQDFLKFSRGHQAAGERQGAENHFHRKHGHHEGRHVGRAQIKFRGAD